MCLGAHSCTSFMCRPPRAVFGSLLVLYYWHTSHGVIHGCLFLIPSSILLFLFVVSPFFFFSSATWWHGTPLTATLFFCPGQRMCTHQSASLISNSVLLLDLSSTNGLYNHNHTLLFFTRLNLYKRVCFLTKAFAGSSSKFEVNETAKVL